MPLGALPPVLLASNSVGVASLYANNQVFIFYYDQLDRMLHMARGTEATEYTDKAIAVGQAADHIHFNTEPMPTPLAAGFDGKKEIRVYYIQSDGTIGELTSLDFGNSWDYGSLTKTPFNVALLGGLTCCSPGGIWRVIIHMKGQLGTFVELYEPSPKSWTQFVIQ